MSTASISRSDVRLRNAVVRQLDWDPEVDDSAIGVSARTGVITLTGFIDSYAGKLAAERSAKHVRGVRAVANDITVRPMVGRTDADIAQDAAQGLKLRPPLGDTVQAVVHRGHVTLTGTTFQKQQAESVVKHVRGVLAVANHITVNPRSGQRDIQRRIVRALHRNADFDARQIDVTVSDDAVRLTGTVRSWSEREAVERAAGSAPGIRRVDNEIRVDPHEPHELEPPDEIC